jgi:DNA recombination protein RmuC
LVHLPDKKDVVIDSKVTLLAYDRYHAAETDQERQEGACK